MGPTPQSERFSTMTLINEANATTGEPYRRKFDCLNYSLLAIHMTWGAITGTWTLWSSDKADPSAVDGGSGNEDDWVQVTEITFTDPSGVAGKGRIDASAVGHRWLMLKYDNSSGANAVAAYVTLKRG